MTTLSPVAPTVQPRDPVEALMAWLLEQDYSGWYRDAIATYLRRHGELAGAVACGYLSPEDEATATEVLVEATEAVPQTSPDWGSPTGDGSRWNELDDRWEISPGVFVVPPELETPDGDDDFELPDWPWDPYPDDQPDDRGESFETAVPVGSTVATPMTPAPISGGAPASEGGYRMVREVEGGRAVEEAANEADVRAAIAANYGADAVEPLIRSMRDDGRTVADPARGLKYFWDPADGELLRKLPSLSGGAPTGPSSEDWDDYREHCAWADHLAEIRDAEEDRGHAGGSVQLW